MTTQLPYDPQAPAGGGYPTAPPWAVPPPAPSSPESAGPPPHTRHGQLLVAYPELMQGASGPTGPSWIPVVIWTFFFSIFGAISAARRAQQAGRSGKGRSPYWVAFGVTLVAGTIIWQAIALAVAVPVYLHYREQAVTKAVQSAIVGQPAGARKVTVAKATCTPLGDAKNGLRTYNCRLVLSNGRTAALKVIADSKTGRVQAAK